MGLNLPKPPYLHEKRNTQYNFLVQDPLIVTVKILAIKIQLLAGMCPSVVLSWLTTPLCEGRIHNRGTGSFNAFITSSVQKILK